MAVKLNKQQLKELRLLAQMELVRRSFEDYLVHVNPGYKHMKHTKVIAAELQEIAEGKQKYIILEVPPRHGKSLTATESFPAYYLGRNPDKRVMLAAYSETLAKDFSRKNRTKIKEYGGIFGIGVDRLASKNTDWMIEGTKGGMLANGIMGGFTGRGADLLLVDDPIKNFQEADSVARREAIWNEWQSSLITRLHDGASVIVIMTRWHEDDIIGRLIEQSAFPWTRLRFPALAEKDDPLGREEGEALAPEIGFDEEYLEATKKRVGSMAFTGMFQQRPTLGQGTIFKKEWFKRWTNLPRFFEEMVQSWDCTFKDKEDSDYVVGQLWGRIGNDVYLIDQVRRKMGIIETMQEIRNMSSRYPEAYRKLIEDKANGSAVIEMLSMEIQGIEPVEPMGGKVARAIAVSPHFEQGKVYIPTDLHWVQDYEDEMVGFPKSKHDDSVDSSTQAVNFLLNRYTVFGSSQNIS